MKKNIPTNNKVFLELFLLIRALNSLLSFLNKILKVILVLFGKTQNMGVTAIINIKELIQFKVNLK